MKFAEFENLTLSTGYREVFRREQPLSIAINPVFHALIDRGVGQVPGVPNDLKFSCKTWPGHAVMDVVWREYIVPGVNSHLCWDARLAGAVWDNVAKRYQEYHSHAPGVPLDQLTPPKTVPFLLTLMAPNYARIFRLPNPRDVAHALTHFELAWAWSVLDRAA